MRKKTQNLNKTNLKKLNTMAHLKSFPSKVKSISSEYQDFFIFVKDFENFVIESKNVILSIDGKSFKKIKQSKVFVDPNLLLANVSMKKYIKLKKLYQL